MLESLEREYRRDDDWCSNEKAATVTDKVSYMQQLLHKHQEQKEAFLKVLARFKRTGKSQAILSSMENATNAC